MCLSDFLGLVRQFYHDWVRGQKKPHSEANVLKYAMLETPDIITLIGLIAGAFTTISFVPQVVRTWRMKSARDLSLATVSLNSTGIFLWLVHGLCVRSIPVIVANFVTFILISTILVLAVKYR